MPNTAKGGDLNDATEVVLSDEVLRESWDNLVTWLLSKQHHPGVLSIPSGPNTGLYARVTKDHLPFGVALDVLEAGVRKPITDISIDKATEGTSWTYAHERRLKRLANWKDGNFSVRGGTKDELASQMKVEFTEGLKLVGFDPSSPKHAAYFKGTVVQMFDALEKDGFKFKGGRDAKLREVREAATNKLAKRVTAAAELDASKLEI
jgi:hypothetical protein